MALAELAPRRTVRLSTHEYAHRDTYTPISDSIVTHLPVNLPRRDQLTDPDEPDWIISISDQLGEISNLQQGWDGFKAGPVRRDVMFFAVVLLGNIMRTNTPPPHVTPMSHEGVQLEWHQNDVDLEIEIETPGEVWVSYENRIDRIDENWRISTDFTSLSEPVSKLTNGS